VSLLETADRSPAMTRRILQGHQPVLDSGPRAAAPRSAAPAARTQLESRLRQRRSNAYIEAARKLDAGTHQGDRAALASLLEAIARELPDLTLDERPLGIVSACHLGAPYEVHICDLTGGLVEHFETFRPMPPLFEGARSLARHPSYAFIEVYVDGYRAVGPDGAVSAVGGPS
jgi:hypothetical protein